MNNYQNKSKEIINDFFLLNNNILPAKDFHQEETTIYPSFYEVIRIIDGVPLFFEEHINRLEKSLNLLNFNLPYDKIFIKNQIHTLIKTNKCYNNNVKIVINSLDTESPKLFVYFITSKYPSIKDYKQGVNTILYKGERDNPNAKIIAKSFREKVNTEIKKANAYEAILVNQKDEITEGSRSNMFFVKDNVFYTSAAKDVLVGITRNRIIQLCNKLEYEIKEQTISLSFLNEIDGLFLTGTSPKILPISYINNKHYDSSKNTAIINLQQAYDDLINQYISKNKGSVG